jgi:hypothetical protein
MSLGTEEVSWILELVEKTCQEKEGTMSNQQQRADGLQRINHTVIRKALFQDLIEEHISSQIVQTQ